MTDYLIYDNKFKLSDDGCVNGNPLPDGKNKVEAIQGAKVTFCSDLFSKNVFKHLIVLSGAGTSVDLKLKTDGKDRGGLWTACKDKIDRICSILPSRSEECRKAEEEQDIEGFLSYMEKASAVMPDNGVLEEVVLKKKSVYIGALGCCMCVRRQFYSDISSYRFNGWAQDDRMWKMAQCAHGCLILHKNLIKHRIHGNNTSTYGKYHTVERRVKLFSDMLEAEKQMLKFLSDNKAEKKEIKLIERHISMMEKRIVLLRERIQEIGFGKVFLDITGYEKTKLTESVDDDGNYYYQLPYQIDLERTLESIENKSYLDENVSLDDYLSYDDIRIEKNGKVSMPPTDEFTDQFYSILSCIKRKGI